MALARKLISDARRMAINVILWQTFERTAVMWKTDQGLLKRPFWRNWLDGRISVCW